MFSKFFALFALVAAALAAPGPKAAPEPSPQLLAYSAGLDYAYPALGAPVVSSYAAAPVVSPYGAQVVSPYGAQVVSPYAAYPAYYLRR